MCAHAERMDGWGMLSGWVGARAEWMGHTLSEWVGHMLSGWMGGAC